METFKTSENILQRSVNAKQKHVVDELKARDKPTSVLAATRRFPINLPAINFNCSFRKPLVNRQFHAEPHRDRSVVDARKLKEPVRLFSEPRSARLALFKWSIYVN